MPVSMGEGSWQYKLCGKAHCTPRLLDNHLHNVCVLRIPQQALHLHNPGADCLHLHIL